MQNGKKAINNIDFSQFKQDLMYRSLVSTPVERFGAGLMFKRSNKREYDNIVHPRYAFVIVFRGKGTFIDESGEKYQITPGTCFKRIPGKAESLSINSNNWVEFFLEIGPALYNALRSMRIIETKPLCEKIDLDEDFLIELIAFKEKFKNADERALPLLVGDFTRILADCQRRCSQYGKPKENVLIDLACGFLSRDFRKECDIKSFCRKHGVGYESFRKLFKDQIGISPWQYRIRRRLDLACALLRNPGMKISEVALELGYSSAYDFSAQFKKYFKASPANYRTGTKK